MKNLKNLFAVGLLSIGLFVTSCTDPCKDVTCQNGGTCNEGNCDCVTGYEGSNCETEVRTKVLGTYTVDDNCSASGTAQYNVTSASSSQDVNTILISGFWELFQNNVTATIAGTTVTIASQQPDNDNYWVSGTGTVADSTGNSITWSYTIVDPSSNSDDCTATWTKQ